MVPKDPRRRREWLAMAGLVLLLLAWIYIQELRRAWEGWQSAHPVVVAPR